jgi:hypothetical protein
MCFDFLDDLLAGAFTQKSFEEVFKIYKSWGISRIYWLNQSNYLDWDIKLWPTGNIAKNAAKTYQNIGDFLPAAVKICRKLDMEIYSVFKMFDYGSKWTFPAGSPGAEKYGKLDIIGGRSYSVKKGLLKLQDLRMERNMNAVPRDIDKRIITKIKLTSDGKRSSGLTEKDIILKVSNDNASFTRYSKPYSFTEKLERGKKVIILDDLSIKEKYLALLVPEKCRKEKFKNKLAALVKLYDEKGKQLPFSYSLMSWKDQCAYLDQRLAVKNSGASKEQSRKGYRFNEDGRAGTDGFLKKTVYALDNLKGYITIARGKEKYLVGSLSPSYKKVQDLWLSHINYALDCGVDGVDLRVLNHERIFDFEEYGFEAPVVREYKKKYGVDIRKQPFNKAKHRQIRAEHFTEFYRRANRLIKSYEKEVHLHVAALTMNRKAGERYMGMHWQWEQWLKEGLADAVTMKDMYPDWITKPFYQKLNKEAGRLDVPIYYCPNFNVISSNQNSLERFAGLAKQSQKDGHAGIILYESAACTNLNKKSQLKVVFPGMKKVLSSLI